jgi:hypothetical protein
MAETLLWLAAAFVLAFVINLVPAFMPSTWMVLAFFYIRYDVPLLPLTIGGALMSGLGRLALAKGSAAFRRRFMPGNDPDLQALAGYLDAHRNVAAPATFLYTLTPFPTNNLFIAAGMVGVNMAWVMAGFWAGRILADTFWVWTTNRAFHSLSALFEGPFGGPVAITLQSLSLISVLVVYRLPWGRWLRGMTDHRAR